MAGSSTDDHREKGSYPTVDTLVILADHLFDNHPFANFAQTPHGKTKTKPSAIYVENRSLLF